MHWSGKTFAILTLLLAGGAVFLTTRTLQVRNQWIASIDAKRLSYEKTVPQRSAAETRLAQLQAEYRQLVQLWAPVIGDNVQVGAIPGDNGGIVLNLGPASGLRQDQIIHVFSPSAGNQSVYVGPFKVTQVDAGRSAAVAAWPLRASDIANWPAPFALGQGCRVYGAVPTAGPNTVQHYAQLLLRKDELLSATQNLRTIHDREIEIANEHLVYRNMELHGDPSLQGDRGVLPQFMIDGLVKAIEDADEARNGVALSVTQLREDLKASYDKVRVLEDRNRRLAASLPQPEPAATTAALAE